MNSFDAFSVFSLRIYIGILDGFLLVLLVVGRSVLRSGSARSWGKYKGDCRAWYTGLQPRFARSSQQGGLKRALDRSSRVGGVDSSIL